MHTLFIEVTPLALLVQMSRPNYSKKAQAKDKQQNDQQDCIAIKCHGYLHRAGDRSLQVYRIAYSASLAGLRAAPGIGLLSSREPSAKNS